MKGWIQESKRHSLAREGIKTGRKIHDTRQYEAGDRSIHPNRIMSYEYTQNLIKDIDKLLSKDDYTKGFLTVSTNEIEASYVIRGENNEIVKGLRIDNDRWVAFIADEDVTESEFVSNYKSSKQNDKIFTKLQLLEAIKDQIESYQDE